MGDVIRTLAALSDDGHAGPSTRNAVAELFGFSGATSERNDDDDGAFKRPPEERPAEAEPAAPLVELLEPLVLERNENVEDFENIDGPEAAAASPGADRVFARLPATATEPCDWYDPLLDHATANRVIRAALRTDWKTRTIEPRSAVRHLARLRPIDELPRVSQRGYRRGGQVLIELGPAMGPFAQDQNDIANRVRRMSGGRIETLGVSEVPAISAAADDGSTTVWKDYRPPASGAPVLILSALGVVGPTADPWSPTSAQWMSFVSQLRQHGARILALVPLAPSRLPSPLRRTVTAVRWDERAGAAMTTATRSTRRRSR
ncbi:MAG: hypothetical protein ACRBK7_28635 [Acidimicrobiales bacterium]